MKQLKFNPDKDMKELEKYGYQKLAHYNSNYFIKYIYTDKEINYETIYVDINTKEIFAYDDYTDEKIEMHLEWIEDLIKANLLIVESDEDEC